MFFQSARETGGKRPSMAHISRPLLPVPFLPISQKRSLYTAQHQGNTSYVECPTLKFLQGVRDQETKGPRPDGVWATPSHGLSPPEWSRCTATGRQADVSNPSPEHLD